MIYNEIKNTHFNERHILLHMHYYAIIDDKYKRRYLVLIVCFTRYF